MRAAHVFAFLSVIFMGLSAPLSAKQYPDHKTLFVNDYANLLPAKTEQRVTDALTKLRRETGIEASVLTLDTRSDFAPSTSLESFATGLFNDWGIGDAQRNDGILILVIHADREMRIELGSGYDRGYDYVAESVIDDFFLPHFRDGDYAVGIEAGTNATIREIAYRKADGQPPPKQKSNSGGLVFWIVGGVMLLVAVVSFLGRRIADTMTRLKTCHKCGRKGGLRRFRSVITSATRNHSGTGRRVTRCTYCDYENETTYTIPRISSSSSSSGGSFGGGSSSGGGASGRW